jgi:long-chain acyl-CoA synthetase
MDRELKEIPNLSDPYRGETVKAYVSLREQYKVSTTPEELIAFCREQMAGSKCPRVVEIIDEIPKTATGKALRGNLRQT